MEALGATMPSSSLAPRWGSRRRLSASWLVPLLCTVLELVPLRSEAQGSGSVASPGLDVFTEIVSIRPIPFTHDPPLHISRFEFGIRAATSHAFRSDQFDLFPKSIGKLLNAHREIIGFEAALSRGRWNEEWGSAPREFRPSGGLLASATEAANETGADEAWKFLISALSGSLCASFEGMDPDHDSSAWVVPAEVPWTEAGQQLRFATLPYEPVCTENLTPWLKLLPCGHHRGLAALLAPIAVAESPFVSLALAITVDKALGEVSLRASLELVLPMRGGQTGYSAWFGSQSFEHCPAAETSEVQLWMDKKADSGSLAKGKVLTSVSSTATGREKVVVAVPAQEFSKVADSAAWAIASSMAEHKLAPWSLVRKEGGHSVSSGTSDGLEVMRDILSQEGRSERLHGRYLLRIANPDPYSGVTRRIRFMDQLPFFVKPLWHTLRATIHKAGAAEEELIGLDAIHRLSLKFVPTNGRGAPTEFFLTADVVPGGTVSVFLDVTKSFIQLREFPSACEKGFDVGSAAWFEADLPKGGDSSVVSSFLTSLSSMPSSMQEEHSQEAEWKLRFSQGLIVLLPMPDFSMPFNVVALSSTALTFFFGSVFRLTAAGRLPHWVMEKEPDAGSRKLAVLKKLLILSLAGGVYALYAVEDIQMKELRAALPEQLLPISDFLEYWKDRVFSSGGH